MFPFVVFAGAVSGLLSSRYQLCVGTNITRTLSWTAQDSLHPHARLTVQGEAGELAFTIDDTGALKTLNLPRWGNPGGGAFHYVDFGRVAEEEGRFGGYTIPTRLRVGWYVGTDRFEPDGEFFRVTIDDAAYR